MGFPEPLHGTQSENGEWQRKASASAKEEEEEEEEEELTPGAVKFSHISTPVCGEGKKKIQLVF